MDINKRFTGKEPPVLKATVTLKALKKEQLGLHYHSVAGERSGRVRMDNTLFSFI